MSVVTAAGVAARRVLHHRVAISTCRAFASCNWRQFSTATATDSSAWSDRCSLNIVSSPYPPIRSGPYPPIAEFVTADWAPDGYLEKQVAILDGSTGMTRTFGDYHETMSGVAAALHYDMDIDEDSTVSIYSPNHVDYLPVSLAVGLCGAKLTPVNPQYTPGELANILKYNRSTVLIVHESILDQAFEATKNFPNEIKHIIVVTDHESATVPAGTISLASLKGNEKQLSETIHAVHQKTDSHPYLLPYSSGTTGLPKGVCLTHQNLVANLLQTEEVEDLGFPSDHKLFSPLPFFHIYGFLVSMLYCAWKGQQIITMSKRFDFELFLKLVEEHKPQRAHLVPPILLGLAKNPLVEEYDLSSLKVILSAAAPLGSDIEQAVVDRLDCAVKQAWGMSELSPLGTINSDFNMKSGSIGPLISSTYGKVVDEAGLSLPANQPGELLLKGPQVMLGYLDAPDKTAECLSKSGWLRTGDVAYYDEDGHFYITDRLKELIKVRGYQVAPAELEALLLTHENVSDAAVIQVPDEASGELPRAYVVMKTDAESVKVSEDDIYKWVKERVAPYKRLDGGVVFVDSVPKSASGKILRRELRDQLESELEKKE